ncbi:glycosyltransferase involved in cell wall biosynthesis [Salinibacter ruber]|uniref:glycosyltransferase family 4 protein n=1 Tax=Salinibacter ruber TaxID=146919 RepID=UPI0021679452|nr:glycosyltransferase family 4 protein [Salinibacter ruber]MCS3672807.1 glycosyltransferase involved in cell wall biosynthesis [Salinibacter ruber]
MKILVAHSGRQHSHQLAQALHEQGWLAGYWTGVPAADPATKGLLYRGLAHLSPQPTLDLPAEAVRHTYVAPLARRVAEAIYGPARTVAWSHCANAWFDRWVARRLPSTEDAVVCYENSALETFRRARRAGITTVLDAASFHHGWQDAMYDPVEPDAVHAAINARKDQEVALADHVLTVSEPARESYLDAGVPPDRITVVPMGADLSAFHPPESRRRPRDGPLTFLFAGHVGQRKGADLLLEASARLYEAGVDHRVRLAGDMAPRVLDEAPPAVEPLGYLSTNELAQAFRRADVLVLPSRHDSFGRTVVEGMATGLPALVSTHVGAKEAITEGETGWVVPAGDADALAERMRWCADHPARVTDMQAAAVEAAQHYTWTAYRERVTSVLGDVIREATAVATGKATVQEQESPAGGRTETPDGPSATDGRAAGCPRTRLAVVATHPVQYQVPWFRALADRPDLDVTVYYDRLPDPEEQGAGFGTAFTWDLPLLEGYDWWVRDDRAAPERRFGPLLDAVAPAWTDIVLATGWHDAFLIRAALWAQGQGVPVLVRGDSNSLRARPPWVRTAHRALLSIYDHFLVVGEVNRRFYRQYGIAAERLHECPRFVENDRFARQYEELRPRREALRNQFGVPDGATCLLFAGKFAEKKHPDHLLAALEEGAFGGEVYALMVGDGPLDDELRRRVRARDLPVTFTGFLNQTEIAEAYAAADVLVLPSDDGETWGLVVNEAMIFECPAIVSDQVGCGPDLVDDGETGYTFPFGDIETLADRMQRIVDRPERRRAMGRRARERVLSEYTIEKGVAGTVEAIQAIRTADTYTHTIGQ